MELKKKGKNKQTTPKSNITGRKEAGNPNIEALNRKLTAQNNL